jgi:ribosome-binding factor A
MKRKPSRKILESLCGQPGPEDGVDPRDFFKPTRNRRTDRKDWQLCRQVSESLGYVLSGECRDAALSGLIIDQVVPAPDSHRLLVTIHPYAPDEDFNPERVLERLQQSLGWLRSEVARSISRRKVPDLVFQVIVHPTAQPEKTGGSNEE